MAEKKKPAKKKAAQPPFEESMSELEEIVRRLETGDTPLEQSIEAFEKGVGLVKDLHKRLDVVDRRIEELGDGGEPEPQDSDTF